MSAANVDLPARVRAMREVGSEGRRRASRAHARRHVELVGLPWTSANKVDTFRSFRALAMDQRVRLLDEKTTIGQLEGICIKLTPGGNETFEGRGADDRAFAVVMGATLASRRPSTPAGAWSTEAYADKAIAAAVRSAFPFSFEAGDFDDDDPARSWGGDRERI
jgi:hypothetical protein